MSSKLNSSDFPTDFDIDDFVSFDYDGSRLSGVVVRVYNARDDYHVLVNGDRYSVNRHGDNMRLER